MQMGTHRVLTPVKYLIDMSASRFTAQAFSTGLLSMLGHDPSIGIRDYEGEIQFTPETYEGAYVRVAVHTGSMEVLDEIKSDDRKKIEQLMYESVLDVERFPTAVFESNAILVEKQAGNALRARVNGELSFRGVAQPHSLDARVVNIGTMLRISGGFSLRQSDYGIKPISFAAGALRLKDEIKFNFELVARMQELE